MAKTGTSEVNSASDALPCLTIVGSFTLDPILAGLRYWSDTLPQSFGIDPTGYGQLMPTLLNPASAWRQAKGPRCVLLRSHDFAGDLREVERTLYEASSGAPTLIVLCDDVKLFELSARDLPSLTILEAKTIFEDYSVTDPFDLIAETAAHIPFTDEANVALAAAITRWADCYFRIPVKLIGVDADNTLWSGVVGEDGPSGIKLSPVHAALQQRLAENADAGRVLALLSKNNVADVDAVWSTRHDFILSKDSFLASHVSWVPKVEGLAASALAFGVADVSAVFIDDNIVECAAIRSAMPAVTTIALPADADPSFVTHLWVLDTGMQTDADRSRAASFRAEAERDSAKVSAPSIESFFADLNLEIKIDRSTDDDLLRIEQLSRRTTQFNAMPMVLDTQSLRATLQDPEASLFSVSVKDRYGDFGLVGAIRIKHQVEKVPSIDFFVLSCRVLGRGVEHQMLKVAARIATELGASKVLTRVVKTERNAPVRNFLASIAGESWSGDTDVMLSCEQIDELAFDPSTPVGATVQSPQSVPMTATTDSGAVYGWIAREMTTGAKIWQAMGGARKIRPEFDGGYVAPAAGLETQIAQVWADVLRFDRVGATDPFLTLGGTSLNLIRIHSILKRSGHPKLEIASMFEFSTVAELSSFLRTTNSSTAVDQLSAGKRVTKIATGASITAARRRMGRDRGIR